MLDINALIWAVTIDLLFALDSVPAVFGVTEQPTSPSPPTPSPCSAYARFFLVKGLLDRLVYLSTGLSLILAFIGVKQDPARPHRQGTPRLTARTPLQATDDRQGQPS